MIKQLLKTATTVALLPILVPAYAVGGAFMNRLLQRQLRRERAKVKSVTDERDAARTNLARLRESYNEAMDSKVDRQCWTYGAGQQCTVEAVAKMLGCDPTIGAVEAEIGRVKQERHDARVNWSVTCGKLGRAQQALAIVGRERDRARRWASLWHERARAYRRALGISFDGVEWTTQEAERAARERDHAEARLEALRGAAQRAVRIFDAAEGTESALTTAALRMVETLNDALATNETAPQGQPPPCPICGKPAVDTRMLVNGYAMHPACAKRIDGARPPVEGDHPAEAPIPSLLCDPAEMLRGAPEHYPADEKIQGWAAAIEKVTRERDSLARQVQTLRDEVGTCRWQIATDEKEKQGWQTERTLAKQIADGLRREIEALRRELRQADEDHTTDCNELRARHREVLAEREREASFALMLESREHSWTTLLSLMRTIAQQAKKGGPPTETER